ncbi:hypothetical protein DFH09DRAFT_1078758 [Mycena vulgaris]|nr:hypothetical protein DFH09DRAFT_1078758 [Mycena vulgaris]
MVNNEPPRKRDRGRTHRPARREGFKMEEASGARHEGCQSENYSIETLGGQGLLGWWPRLAFCDARSVHQSHRGGTMPKPTPSNFERPSMEPRVTRLRKVPLTQAVPDPPRERRPKRKATESSNAAADPPAAKTAVKKSKSKSQITAPEPPAIKKSKSKATATEKTAAVPVNALDGGNNTDEDLAPIRPKARPRIRAMGAAGDLATDPFDLSHRRHAISKKSNQEPVPADKADETSTNAPALPEDVDDVPNKTTPILPTTPAGSPRPVFYSSSAHWGHTMKCGARKFNANPTQIHYLPNNY